jgi:ATP-dependent DNA helicase PIF1
LLGSVVKTLEEKHGKANVFVTATTGLAACIIEGTTVHQFAGINGGACEDGASSDHSATVKSVSEDDY